MPDRFDATCSHGCRTNQEHFDIIFADAPPLTPQQGARIAAIMRPAMAEVLAEKKAENPAPVQEEPTVSKDIPFQCSCKCATLDEHAERLVADWPPLTPQQGARLAAIFAPALEQVRAERAGADTPNATAPILPAPRAAEPAIDRRTALYRHYDAAGVLLYIGITGEVTTRTKSHARKAAWTQFADRCEARWYPDRESATEAERKAIEEEHPLFNGTYHTDEAKRRMVQYLMDKDRLDLLYLARG